MSKKAVKEMFEALFALTDIRQIFRETTPKHEFSTGQKEKAKKAVARAREALDAIEEELSLK